jgi:hypothetical protein
MSAWETLQGKLHYERRGLSSPPTCLSNWIITCDGPLLKKSECDMKFVFAGASMRQRATMIEKQGIAKFDAGVAGNWAAAFWLRRFQDLLAADDWAREAGVCRWACRCTLDKPTAT